MSDANTGAGVVEWGMNLSPSFSEETRRYLDGFVSMLGTRSLPTHLLSHPRWQEVRDEAGRNPLMLALGCKGASPDLFRIQGVKELAGLVDHQGHGFWYHLLLHRHRMPSRDIEKWWKVAGDIPADPSPNQNRGWMVDRVCAYPNRSASGEAPASTERWTCLVQKETSPEDLWWKATEEEAQVFLNWMVKTRIPTVWDIAGFDLLVLRTLPDFPENPYNLPPSLRKALAFNMLLVRQSDDFRKWRQDFWDSGEWFEVSPIVREALCSSSQNWLSREELLEFFVKNENNRLAFRLPKEEGNRVPSSRF